MDERPFPPAEPIHLGDEDERLAATLRRMRRRRATKAGVGAAVVAAVVAVAALLLVPASDSRKITVAVGSPCDTSESSVPAGCSTLPTVALTTTTTMSTLPAVPTTPAVVMPTLPSTTTTTTTVSSTTVASTTKTTGAGKNVTSGTVTGPDGQPAPGAYVIGLTNLVVARTDATGHYSTPCVKQKLVGASWLLPILSPSPGPSGGFVTGKDTTNYEPPPTAAGPGYRLSGGVSDLSAAITVACDGKPVDFKLPPGGVVDITWVGPLPSELPIDNLYIPGLGQQAGLETAPVSPTRHQVIAQLGPGTLRIDGVSTAFTCAGTGVGGGGAIWTVLVHSGQTSPVTCTIQ